jgi:hypothetical protein
MELPKNYMPTEPSREDVDACNTICNDDKIFSDQSGLSNKDKWDYVQQVFNCDGQCNLFSAISFENIYQEDDVTRACAASYIADLRVQYLRAVLIKKPVDLTTHMFYVRNKQWWAKLRERVNLKRFSDMAHATRLT